MNKTLLSFLVIPVIGLLSLVTGPAFALQCNANPDTPACKRCIRFYSGDKDALFSKCGISKAQPVKGRADACNFNDTCPGTLKYYEACKAQVEHLKNRVLPQVRTLEQKYSSTPTDGFAGCDTQFVTSIGDEAREILETNSIPDKETWRFLLNCIKKEMDNRVNEFNQGNPIADTSNEILQPPGTINHRLMQRHAEVAYKLSGIASYLISNSDVFYLKDELNTILEGLDLLQRQCEETTPSSLRPPTDRTE